MTYEEAIQEVEKGKELVICEPCNCGLQIMHNNGGNYHEMAHFRQVANEIQVRFETTCTMVPDEEWQLRSDWKKIIQEYAKWL